MTDIALTWNQAVGYADWSIVAGDLALGPDVETAVLVSLFSDARATPDFVLTDGSQDRRGWWADVYEPDPIGSNLWQLSRAKRSDATALLNEAKRYCQTALQWMIDDGVATTVVVNVAWLTRTALGIQILVYQPGAAQPTQMQFSWAWQGV